MGTLKIFILMFAVSLPGLSMSWEYQPIKITVNENFNSQPSAAAHGISSSAPSFVHQGANFFFNPQLQLPIGLIPPQIENLIASSHKHGEPTVMINNPPSSLGVDFPTGHIQSTMVSEISLPADAEPVSIIQEVKIEKPKESIEILSPSLDIPIVAPEISISIKDKTETIIEEVVATPEVSILPLTSVDCIPTIISEVVEIQKPQESIEILAPLPELDITVPEITLPINDETETIIEELVAIPEAPILPPLEFMPVIITEEIKKPEESIEIIAQTPEIHVPIHYKPELIIEELKPIPEAPILSPLIVDVVSPVVTEEIKIEKPSETILPCTVEVTEKPIFLEESLEILPLIPDWMEQAKPIIIPEIPLLIEDEPETIVEELVPIPEAPILPPLSFHFSPPVIVEEKPLLEESVDVLLTLPDIPKRPEELIIVPECHGQILLENNLKPTPCMKDVVTISENIKSTVISKTEKAFIVNEELTMPLRKKYVKKTRRNYLRPTSIPIPNYNIILKPKLEQKNQYIYPSSCAHSIVTKRIAPNLMMKGHSPKLLKLVARSTSRKIPVKVHKNL